MPVTIGDLLTQLVQDRDAALTIADDTERQKKAADVLRDSMFIVHKILGPDLLAAACGQVDETDRAALLQAVAQRSAIFGCVFGTTHGDAASPWRVAEEAIAVARGDAPLLFARIDRHKVNHRIIHAKFEALKWDAYLKGRGMRAGERQELIVQAFGGGTSWETIRRAWRRDVQTALESTQITYLMTLALLEGKRGDPRWEQMGNPDWEGALKHDGKHYLRVLAENYGNR